MKLTPEEVEDLIRYQVGALTGFLRKHDLPLNHIKPHGSLYGMLARDEALMLGAVRVARDYGVPVFGIAGSAHQRVAEREGVAFVGELYVDLDYNAEGGTELTIEFGSICVHSDTPNATEVASAVREALAA